MVVMMAFEAASGPLTVADDARMIGQVAAKDKDLKERLAHERGKLETTVAKVKDTKRKFDAVAGEPATPPSFPLLFSRKTR